MKTLHTVQAEQYEYNYWEGVEVIRCFAMMDTQYSARVPGESLREVLAIPIFRGTPHDEQIEWQTDKFVSEPVRLDSLSGEDYLHYKGILEAKLGKIRQNIADFPSGAAGLFRQAVYCSENCVWCADDKVVISNWGMKPKDQLDVSIISLDGIQPVPPVPSVSEIVPETETQPDEPKVDKPQADGAKGGAPIPVARTTTWRKWLLWGIPLLLLLVLAGLLLLLKKDSGNYGMGQIPTEFGPGNIRESDDGLREEVDNRIILLLEDDSAVEGFVKIFREQYPDKEIYNLTYPDKSLPRLVLEVPPEERDRLMELLPAQFSDLGLSAFPDIIFESEAIPTDPGFSVAKEQWYFDMIDVYDAWNETYGNKNVVVAVIDNGFDLSHPELRGKVIKAYNAVTHTSNVTVDEDVHGTHVASTAVGNVNNGSGVSGIAPGCSLIAIQVGNSEGLMSTNAIVDGLLYAINSGADVVNMSLGGHYKKGLSTLPIFMQEDIIRNTGLDEERMWNRLFDMAAKKNVTVVLSGGNANVLVGIDPMKRSPNTIRVSAVQPDKYKASFSNYGALSTLSAPGVDIYNALPGGDYDFLDGTSMAAPVVTGAVALLKSKHQGLQTAQAVQMLRETGIPSPSDVAVIINLGKAMMAEVPSMSGARDTTTTSLRSTNPPRGNNPTGSMPPPQNNHPRTTGNGSSPDFPGGIPVYPTTPYTGSDPTLSSPYVGAPGNGGSPGNTGSPGSGNNPGNNPSAGNPGGGSGGSFPTTGTGTPVYGGTPGSTPSTGMPGGGTPGSGGTPGGNPSTGVPGGDPRTNPYLSTPGSGNPMNSPYAGNPGGGNNPGNNPYAGYPGGGNNPGNNPYAGNPGGGNNPGNNPYAGNPGGGNNPGNNPYSGNPGGGNNPGNNPYSGNPGGGNNPGNNPYSGYPGGGNNPGNNPYAGNPGGGNTPGNNPYAGTPGGGNNPGNNPYAGTPSGGNNPVNNPYAGTPGGGNNPGNNPYTGMPGSPRNNPSFGNPGGGLYTPAQPWNNPYFNNPAYGGDPSDPCSSVRARYQQLLDELDRLMRECPDCFSNKPDTLQIPKGVRAADLNGMWRSTTYLHNDSGEPLVLFFNFNGSSTAELIVVEPSGEEYHAPLDVSVDSDIIRLYQTAYASNGKQGYSPYSFTLRPGKDRKSVGTGVNQMDAVNKIAFSLVRVS